MNKTLAELFQEYINESQYSVGLRPETLKGYRAVFDHFSTIMPEIINVELLTTENLNEFFKRIRLRSRIVGRDTIKVGLEDSTIKTYGSKLNVFFVWLMRRGLLQNNPLTYIKLKQPVYKDKRALSKGDILKIHAAIALHSKGLLFVRDRMMVSILFYCGLRKTELMLLRVTDIDLVKNQLTVRAETSKSKKTRILPMNPTLVLHVKEYLKERKLAGKRNESLIVSTEQDKGLSSHGLKHWVERLRKKSGVRFHLHQFRHSFASGLGSADVGATKIQALMGHTDPRMTQVYLRSITCEDLRADICKLSL